MCGIGARRERIRAAVGPAIAQASYEVGPEFRDRFVDAAPENGRFLVASARAGHHMFDLAGYVAARLGRLGLAGVETVAVATCAEEGRFFRYRPPCLRGERAYGAGAPAIVDRESGGWGRG